MAKYLAKNRKEALKIAKKKRYYASSVGLHNNQKNVGKKKRWTAAMKFPR